MMINFGRTAALAGLLIFLACAPAGAQKDRIVAVVNGDVITLRQLDSRVNVILKSRQALGMDRDDLRRRILDNLIDQELINQAAKAKGVYVTEPEVSQALDSIKKDNNLTDEQFQASLVHSGTTLESFRDDLRMELLRNRVMGAQVVSKIVTTEKEVVAFLNGDGPEGLRLMTPGGDTRPLRMIIIPANPSDKSGSLAQARRVKEEIDGGLSFAEAARKYSHGPGKDNGGDPGDGATVATLPPPLQAAMAALRPGQPTDPLDAGNAIVLLTVADDGRAAETASGEKKTAADFSPEEKENARRQLEMHKMQQRYGDWVKDLKRNATIRINL